MKSGEKYIGNQFKKIRQRLGLKQQNVADNADIPINTIKNVESNRCCSMQFETLLKLKSIGFDLNELITEDPA